jgi:hypothetical protein
MNALLQRASVQVFHQQMRHGCSLTTDWGDYQPKEERRASESDELLILLESEA